MTAHHDFLNPRCIPSKLDLYGPRCGTLRAITEQLSNFHGTLLDVGCGQMPYKSLILASPSRVQKYIGLDFPRTAGLGGYAQLPPPDLEWNGQAIPLAPDSVDCAICTEVFGNIRDVGALMREIARVLKPGGFFYFTTPFFWPLTDVPYDSYRLTPFVLERFLTESGYEDIRIKSSGGWDASFGSMIALWVRRRPWSPWKRSILSLLATPVVKVLTDRDIPPERFVQSTMLTGTAGTARKPITANHKDLDV